MGKETNTPVVMTGEQFKVAEEVAIVEIKAFVEYHQDVIISSDKASDDYVDIAKDFRHILKAVKRGLLNLSDTDAPVYTLRDPIMTEGGNTATGSIVFKTRITKGTMAQLSKGMDIVKNPVAFSNVLTTYYTQLGAISLLDKLSKTDTGVVDEMVGLFQ